MRGSKKIAHRQKNNDRLFAIDCAEDSDFLVGFENKLHISNMLGRDFEIDIAKLHIVRSTLEKPFEGVGQPVLSFLGLLAWLTGTGVVAARRRSRPECLG